MLEKAILTIRGLVGRYGVKTAAVALPVGAGAEFAVEAVGAVAGDAQVAFEWLLGGGEERSEAARAGIVWEPRD